MALQPIQFRSTEQPVPSQCPALHQNGPARSDRLRCTRHVTSWNAHVLRGSMPDYDRSRKKYLRDTTGAPRKQQRFFQLGSALLVVKAHAGPHDATKGIID